LHLNSLGKLGEICGPCRFEVGDGNHMRFWHDKWCGSQTLKIAYQKLFATPADKDASVDPT